MTVKLKALLGALVVGALGAAVAFAAPPPGKGHNKITTSTVTVTVGGTVTTSTSTVTIAAPTTTGSTKSHGKKPSCIPQVMLIVKGTATGDASADAVSINVTGGNHFAKLLFKNNTTTSLTVNKGADTTVTAANGQAQSLTAIKKDDRVLAQYKVCKSSVTGNSVNVSSASSLATYLSSSVKPRKIVDLGKANT